MLQFGSNAMTAVCKEFLHAWCKVGMHTCFSINSVSDVERRQHTVAVETKQGKIILLSFTDERAVIPRSWPALIIDWSFAAWSI